MAAENGRMLLLKKAGAVIASLKTKTFSIGAEPIDITTDDAEGYRTILGTAGQYSIDISGDGIYINDGLSTLILNGGSVMLTDITLELPSGAEIEGNFFMPSYEISGTYNDAITFSFTLQSSGEWTFTAAP